MGVVRFRCRDRGDARDAEVVRCARDDNRGEIAGEGARATRGLRLTSQRTRGSDIDPFSCGRRHPCHGGAGHGEAVRRVRAPFAGARRGRRRGATEIRGLRHSRLLVCSSGGTPRRRSFCRSSSLISFTSSRTLAGSCSSATWAHNSIQRSVCSFIGANGRVFLLLGSGKHRIAVPLDFCVSGQPLKGFVKVGCADGVPSPISLSATHVSIRSFTACLTLIS